MGNPGADLALYGKRNWVLLSQKAKQRQLSVFYCWEAAIRRKSFIQAVQESDQCKTSCSKCCCEWAFLSAVCGYTVDLNESQCPESVYDRPDELNDHAKSSIFHESIHLGDWQLYLFIRKDEYGGHWVALF